MARESTRHVIYDPQRGALRTDDSARGPAGASLLAGLQTLVAALPRVVTASVGRGQATGRRHVHDNLGELRLILSGQGMIAIAGTTYAYRAGDLLLMDPGNDHETLQARAVRQLSLHIWSPVRRRQRATLPHLSMALGQQRHCHLGVDHPTAAALQRAEAAWRARLPGAEHIAACAVAEALLLLGRPEPVSTDDDRSQRDAAVVATIHAHIARHHAEAPAIDALLRPFGLHPNYLRGIYKQHTGTSIRAAWLKARITAACTLLRDPSLSIAAIAAQVGFQDYQAFVRRFRALTGQTPSAYREQTLRAT